MTIYFALKPIICLWTRQIESYPRSPKPQERSEKSICRIMQRIVP